MRHVLKVELLEAMRQCLRDLESVKLVRADDPDVNRLKEHLRRMIVEKESEDAEHERYYEMAA